MELHLHLSVAFRALDNKWGKPIDLDSSEESLFGIPCLPAVIERPTTTFSSEEFLRTRRVRPKPYSRYQEHSRKENIKINDSFADISSSRIPLSETEATSIDSGLDKCTTMVTRLVEELTRSGDSGKGDSCESLESVLDDGKVEVLKPYLKQWKNTAKSFIVKKCKRKVRS
ncbi:Bifunctional protein FolC [Operophtera brumata]|uniref:Bifunctional protein FolC n=1 Tax=Operophtera brumata TaxID=104452 RepID=A0A0L7L5L7_OPEBR|nr:Bifunctional protein FolC [Operophtera brumata]